ncbi:unnamed protein product [Parajaminaea phylloscopi]
MVITLVKHVPSPGGVEDGPRPDSWAEWAGAARARPLARPPARVGFSRSDGCTKTSPRTRPACVQRRTDQVVQHHSPLRGGQVLDDGTNGRETVCNYALWLPLIMANKTSYAAQQVHGTNPQFLIEKVLRSRIYDSVYWKEHCFALTAETLIDKALALDYIGGTYGVQKPSPFICLVLKLLQLQPEKVIVLEYLKATEFKYLRALAAFYVRLTFKAVEAYETLEPLLEDYRKLRFRRMDGGYFLTHMDEFIDDLLVQERVCEVVLPRMTRRDVLEETEGLHPRVSQLEDALLATNGEGQDDEDDEPMRARWLAKIKRRRALEGMSDRRDKDSSGRLESPQSRPASPSPNGGYASQELSDEEGGAPRYISRSPSRSISPEALQPRYVSRSPSRSASPQHELDRSHEGHARQRSRSRSVSSTDGRYVSRSPSESPART